MVIETKHRTKSFWFIIIAAVLCSTLAAACRTYSPTPTSTPTLTTQTPTPSVPASAPSTVTVTMFNYSFQPSSVTINVGDTVYWVNADLVTHTVTSDSGMFDSGKMPPDDRFSYTFHNASTYTYHCSIHTSMKGTVIVK